MDSFDSILSDWHSCRPDGVVLRATKLGAVIDCVTRRVRDSPADVDATLRRKALELLAPSCEEGGLPPLVQQLRIDGTYRMSSVGCQGGRINDAVAVVHYVFFWRALQHVSQRLLGPRHPGAASSTVASPEGIGEHFAGEVTEFRERVVVELDCGTLTAARFREHLAFIRQKSNGEGGSADDAAWEGLAALLPPANEELMPIDMVSSLFFVWLGGLVEDYCRGQRWSHICSICDVLGCKKRDASALLSAGRWDIESALRSYYAKGSPMAALQACNLEGAWSSQSAKLRSKELQCPICVSDFELGRETTVTQCCFQAICGACVAAMRDRDGVMRCPFCRGNFIADGGESAVEVRGPVAVLLEMAGRCEQVASRAAESIAARLQASEGEEPLQSHWSHHNLRMEAMLGLTATPRDPGIRRA